MPVPFFDLSRQNKAIKQSLDPIIAGVVDSGRYILGENVSSLEKEVAAYCGTKFAVGVASGTDALHLALRASGIGPGDEVITSPFTFVATAEAIAYCGATPVFVDIEPNTFNIDPSKIAKSVSKKTKAILPVHLFGLACDMSKIMEIAGKFNLKVVEDCAQSLGAKFNGKMVGSFGDFGCFSFFPTKNLGCFGDGGMITTNDQELAEQIKVLRGHGSRKTYHYDLIGYNSRLDELQASILRLKLPLLDSWSDLRRHHASRYYSLLEGISSIQLPSAPPNSFHVYNQFTIRLKDRDELFDFLRKKEVGCMVYYPLSLHLQKAFIDLGYKSGDFPASEAAQNEVLSLPVFPELSKPEIEAVAYAIKAFFKE